MELIESSEQLEASAQEEVEVEKRLLHFRNVLQTNPLNFRTHESEREGGK